MIIYIYVKFIHVVLFVVLHVQLLAELIGTYFVIFAGCGSVAVNKLYGGTVTFPGVCVTWGMIVMAMIYAVGHVSGAHFNPAVTITSSALGLLSYKEVYVLLLVENWLFVIN